MPHVLAFDAAETPDHRARVAEAFGLPREWQSINDLLGEMRRPYADIGFDPSKSASCPAKPRPIFMVEVRGLKI